MTFRLICFFCVFFSRGKENEFRWVLDHEVQRSFKELSTILNVSVEAGVAGDSFFPDLILLIFVSFNFAVSFEDPDVCHFFLFRRACRVTP